MIMLSFFNFYLSAYLYLIKLIGKTYIIYYTNENIIKLIN